MATTSLIELFQGLNTGDGSNETRPQAICLPFNPGSDFRIRSEGLRKVDRYLFRVFDKNSDGSTDNIWAKSRDVNHPEPCANSYKDIFARDDRREAAQALRRHLQWDGGPHEEDNFVSWSSSLLVVLQYAHFRARHFPGNDLNSTSGMSLCVVDTTLLPPMSFMRDMDLLSAFSQYDDTFSEKTLPNLQSLRRKKHTLYSGSYYFGEYLSQGALRIEGCCSIRLMQDIIDAGLYKLREELKSAATGAEMWANKVIMLREKFYTSRPWPVDDNAVAAALHIGNLYGSTWVLPIALAFLALQPRFARDDAMIEKLRCLYCKGEPISILSPTRAEADIVPKVLNYFNSHLKR